ncbi:MAG: hypothetical protein RMJ53_10720 [Chitinophagales bacterium]|nr:hypothetical protein [Chitinophagales bacterium]MDW8274691.1 hypothetical protein [Chitinophagales bacterium]
MKKSLELTDMSENQILRLRKTENIHILLWLLKDVCWVADFKTAGMIMAVPTLSVAFYITWKYRSMASELFHNLAVCCWITANIIWMTGEFFFDDNTRPLAICVFIAGLLIVSYYYISVTVKKKLKINTSDI